MDLNTADRLAQLGQGIIDNAHAMEAEFLELTRQADAELARAAHAFIIEHAQPDNPTPRVLYSAYAGAHEALLKAAVAATNIRDLWKRSNTLRAKCQWWDPARLTAAVNQLTEATAPTRKRGDAAADPIESGQ